MMGTFFWLETGRSSFQSISVPGAIFSSEELGEVLKAVAGVIVDDEMPQRGRRAQSEVKIMPLFADDDVAWVIFQSKCYIAFGMASKGP